MKIFDICDCVHQPLESNNREGSTHSHPMSAMRFSGSEWHTTICVKEKIKIKKKQFKQEHTCLCKGKQKGFNGPTDTTDTEKKNRDMCEGKWMI